MSRYLFFLLPCTFRYPSKQLQYQSFTVDEALPYDRAWEEESYPASDHEQVFIFVYLFRIHLIECTVAFQDLLLSSRADEPRDAPPRGHRL